MFVWGSQLNAHNCKLALLSAVTVQKKEMGYGCQWETIQQRTKDVEVKINIGQPMALNPLLYIKAIRASVRPRG